MPLSHFKFGIQASPVVGANVIDTFQSTRYSNPADPIGGNIYFVDGDNGSDAFDGHSPEYSKKTIGGALLVSSAGAVIYVKARKIAAGATDPTNYAETIIIGASQAGTKLVGLSSGVAQGYQPQIKKGSGSTAHITVRAPGCLIAGITVNMVGSTAAGVLLDDDDSTKTAFGTVIDGCIFKGNANITSAAGAVCIGANGGAWQLDIRNNKFIDCATSINALGTTVSPLKDITIENNKFYAFATADTDADIMFNVGLFASGLVINNNVFGTVGVPTGFGSAATSRYLDLTGCKGILSNNFFAEIGSGTGFKTWGATGNAALIPTTVRMAGNYGEWLAGGSGVGGSILRT